MMMSVAESAAEAVRAGRLAVVLAKHEAPALPIQLVYPAARLGSAALRAFVELCASTRRWSFVDL